MLNTLSNVNYDSKNDVLNYKISSTSNSYGEEDIDGIIYLKDMTTDEITGYTLMNFAHTYVNNKRYYSMLDGVNIDELYEMVKNML